MNQIQLRKKYTRERLVAIRAQFQRDVDAWKSIQKQGAEDIQCISTEQGPWPDAEWNARHVKGQERPCLHEDVLTQYVNQVVNQIEMNPMGIEATPAGEGATEESAAFIENRIRAIEYEDSAQYAYLTAAKNAIERSYGFWKLETAYRSKFAQKVCIEPVMDPDSVIPGFAKKPDWSDMRDAWEMERMTHLEFRERYPKARIKSFSADLQAEASAWIDDSTVMVVAWWHFESDERELLRIDSPEGPTEAYTDEFREGTKAFEGEITDRRQVSQKRVLKTILNGVEALDETEWIDPGDGEDAPPEIPILVVTGRIKYEKGQRVIESLVRKGRVGQLLYDYTISAIQEAIGMTPKVKAWGPEGTFDTNTNWARLSRDPAAYAEWKPVVDPETGQSLPPPQFITYEPPIQALELAKQSILIGIQNAIGMSSTERKDRTAKSGKALDQLAQEMSIATAHYFGASRIAQERQYRILQRILKPLEEDQPQVALRDKKGKHELTDVNPAFYQARHSVTVGAGKLYQTLQDKQEATAQDLMNIKAPEILLAVLPGALRMRGLGDYGEELAKLIESIQPAPMQQARQAKDGQPIPPEVQQAMQQAQQAVQALNAHAEQLEEQLHELQAEQMAKKLEMDSRERIAADDNRTKIEVAEIQASVKEDINTLNQQVASMRHIADVLTQRYGIDQQAEGASLDRDHQAEQAGLQRDQQMAIQDRDQAHARETQQTEIDASETPVA